MSAFTKRILQENEIHCSNAKFDNSPIGRPRSIGIIDDVRPSACTHVKARVNLIYRVRYGPIIMVKSFPDPERHIPSGSSEKKNEGFSVKVSARRRSR